MLFLTHIVFALFAYAFLIGSLHGHFLFFIFVVIGAALVDIDSANSCVGKKWYFRPLQLVVSHRGVFHTLLTGFLISLVVWLISKNAGYGLFFGYVSHLLLDCCTKQGVKLFWPISGSNINFFSGIKTGGLWEQLLLLLLVIVDGILYYRIIF